ncbi:MAG TPA: glycosyltransferase family 39 protein [Tepidisphaeraceae bacterium]|nr:glycosyltransferase family 39 protein [Tepidisphaeraceae bacterium]
MPLDNQAAGPAVEFRSASTTSSAAVAALVAAGALIWIGLGTGRGIGWTRWIVILAAIALGLAPPIATLINAVHGRLRNASPRAIRITAIVIALVSAGYFMLTALLQGRDLFPKTHDECSYWLQTQMLAHGHLFMPGLPLPDFFASFYILTTPVYCSIYFPGTAVMLAPAVWLHLPPWIWTALLSGLTVGVLYLVITELIDGAAGVLAAILLVSLTWFRTLGLMTMSQMPMLQLGLLMVYAWLRWRRRHHSMWALAIGILAGWAAITRPVDALCYAIPIGVAMAIEIRDDSLSRKALCIALLIVGAVPFLGLQVRFDQAVTGHPFQTPYTTYLAEQVPGSTFGFHRFNPAAEPQSTLPQMRRDYELTKSYLALHQPQNFLSPWIRGQHPAGFAPRPAYLAMIADTTLPTRALLLLIPAGLLGLTGRGRIVLFATFPVFVLLYILNPFFLEHYSVPIIPAVLLLVLLGANAVADALPSTRGQIGAALVAGIVAAAVTSLWEINHVLVANPAHQITDEPMPSALLRKAHDVLTGERAVVLFRYAPNHNWKAEPVYNSDVTWPDDAEVVRAHDLGARDVEIVKYYAQRQPDRTFFVWDLGKDELRRIGTAADLWNAVQRGKDLDLLLHPK